MPEGAQGRGVFRHQPRTTDPTSLVRGALLRAAIALAEAIPASDRTTTRDTWELPPISGILDEHMQVWLAWIGTYTLARAVSGDEVDGENEDTVEVLARQDFQLYSHILRDALDDLANGCLSGHKHIRSEWLANLHGLLVRECGWSAAELVTHVMRLHRQQFPRCVKKDAELIRNVQRYTLPVEPLIVNHD